METYGKGAASAADMASAGGKQTSFSLSAGQLQALAEEVGAALVNYVVKGRPQELGRELAVRDMDPAAWNEYFRLAFGAVSAAEDGVCLGDFMFKDTARHRRIGDDYVVTVLDREVEMYLENAFGPEVTPETIGKSAVDGSVTFAAMPDSDPNIVEPLGPWDEAQTGLGNPLQLRFRLGSVDAPEGPEMLLKLHAAPAPESEAYGCHVLSYCVAAAG